MINLCNTIMNRKGRVVVDTQELRDLLVTIAKRLENQTVDMSTCKPHDRLLTKHGKIVTYVEKMEGYPYPHSVVFSDGGCGNRCDNGKVFAHKSLPEDEDIVLILGQ